jgi:hypothetical protein
MLTAEWNWDDAKRVWQKEAGGRARDEEIRDVINLINSGYSLDELREILADRLSSIEGSQHLSAR